MVIAVSTERNHRAPLQMERVSGCPFLPRASPLPDEDDLPTDVYRGLTSAPLALGVYEIFPSSKEPVFKCIASWEVPVDARILSYSSQYVVLTHDGMAQVYAVSDGKGDGPRCNILHNGYIIWPKVSFDHASAIMV